MPRKKPHQSLNPTAFSLTGKQPQASVKREISTRSQINSLEDTLIYGEDDALPLRIAKLVSESPATSACVSTRSRFIKGSGFSNKDLMRLKIDKDGTTLWQLHTMLSDMLSLFRGFAVNFKFDAGGGITNSYVLSFESCRLQKPDDKGYITHIKYNPYFGTQEFKKEFTTPYHTFNKEQILNQMEEEGNSYNGQVYYYGKTTPVYRFYPVPEYWSAKNWIQIDAKIQEFHNENLENGFFQSVLMNVIGDPSAKSNNPKYTKSVTGTDNVKRNEHVKTVGEEFNETMSSEFSGTRKGGTALVTWSQNHDTAVKIQAFPTNANADLFTALQDLTTKNITIATKTPGILANISEGVNLGSGGSEIQKAVELMQGEVSEDQQLLEQFYNEVLLPNLSSPTNEKVEIVNFTPVTVPVEIDDKFWEAMDAEERRDFIRANVAGVKLKDPVVVPVVSPVTMPDGTVEPIQEPTKVNENLKNMTGRQLQGVLRVVRKFNNGELTFEQAKQLLISGSGFTDADVEVWLVTPEEA